MKILSIQQFAEKRHILLKFNILIIFLYLIFGIFTFIGLQFCFKKTLFFLIFNLSNMEKATDFLNLIPLLNIRK